MKVVFVSNYFNHHQKDFCDAMERNVEKFIFVSTSEMREERKNMGYILEIPKYVLCAYESESNWEKSVNIINTAEIVIVGSAPEKLLRKRVLSKKIIFRYLERPIRREISVIDYLFLYVKGHIKYPNHKNTRLLCASAFTYSDFQRLGLFRNRAYKWGYYPTMIEYSDIQKIISNKNKTSILWCGRFLKLKNPEHVIKLASLLQKNNYNFEIKFIGSGEEEELLIKRVLDEQLENCISFLGTMKPKEVRKHMEESGIFLFTSNKEEGWGAVLNEAMNSGCAVVASHEIGAVPYLIDDNKNGMIYESGNIDMLFQKVRLLLDHPQKQREIGEAAYYTIVDEWNGNIAAKRFCKLAEQILNNNLEYNMYENGPCSRAEIIYDDWIKKDM